jgi:hypothetical protein
MFWKTLGKWAIVAVAVPLAAAGFRKLGHRMETRAGSSSRLSRTLERTASGLDIVSGRRGRAATQ